MLPYRGIEAMPARDNGTGSNARLSGGGGCRRTTGRRQQEELTCELGPIADLSRGGMRIIARQRLRGEHDVTMITLEGPLTVRVRVAWARRTGRRRYLVGMEFLEVDKMTAEKLTKISTVHARCFRLVS